MTNEILMAGFAGVGVLAWLADKFLFPATPNASVKESKRLDIDDDDDSITTNRIGGGYVGIFSDDDY